MLLFRCRYNVRKVKNMFNENMVIQDKKFDLLEKCRCCQRKHFQRLTFFQFNSELKRKVQIYQKRPFHTNIQMQRIIFYTFIIKSCFICKFFDLVFAYIFITNSIVCKIIYKNCFLHFLQILFEKQCKKGGKRNMLQFYLLFCDGLFFSFALTQFP